MGERTAIQWSDSTLNVMMGCDGCELWDPKRGIRICYAGVDTTNKTARGPLKGWPTRFDRPEIFPERIGLLGKWRDLTGLPRPGKPWLDGHPRTIFWNDMGDAWTASLPRDWLAPFLPAMAASPHRHLFLTKRPDRAAAFSRSHVLPPNVWLGTSITGPQDARLRALLRAQAAVKFVSYEPVLHDAGDVVRRFPEIAWWIIGGASGTDAWPTDLAVLRGVVAAGREAGAAVFIKQVGTRALWSIEEYKYRHGERLAAADLIEGRARFYTVDRKGGDWSEWPDDLRVRQYPGPDPMLF